MAVQFEVTKLRKQSVKEKITAANMTNNILLALLGIAVGLSTAK